MSKSLAMGFLFTLWYLILMYPYSAIFGINMGLTVSDALVFTGIFSVFFALIYYWGKK